MNMMRSLRALTLAVAGVVVAGAGCGGCFGPAVPPGEGEGEGEGDGNAELNACVPVDEGPGFAISSKADLRWKRVVPLQNDLMTALQLDEQSVCSELGLDGFCFQLIHLVPLGGNEPVRTAMYKPIAEPGVTSPLSFERVVVSACGRRADVDASVQVGQRLIWRNIDMNASALAVDDAGLRGDIGELYRRVLAREATAAELDLVASLAEPVNGEAPTARDVAKMACIAVATTSEFLFH